MKQYKQLVTEISGTLIKNYLERAGGALKTMVTSPNKQELLPKIIKRSKGIKLAKAKIAKEVASHSIPDFSPKLQYIYNHYKDSIAKALKNDGTVGRLGLFQVHQTPEEFIRVAARYDPSGEHHDYLEWMIKQYINGGWIMEDLKKVRDALIEFEQIKPKLQNKDINTYKNMGELYDVIEDVKPALSKNATIELAKRAGTTVLVDNPEMKLLKLNNMGAVKQYCKGTRWCFSSDYETFKDYKAGLYLIIAKINGKVRKFAFHRNSEQFMNERDDEISMRDLITLSKLPGWGKVEDLYFLNFNSAQQDGYPFEKALEYSEVLGKQLPKLETQLVKKASSFKTVEGLKNSGLIENMTGYAINLKKRIPTFERFIAMDAYEAVEYAKEVLKGPFPAAEVTIAKDGDQSYDYATQVLKKAFPAGERAMLKEFGGPTGDRYRYRPYRLLNYYLKIARKRIPNEKLEARVLRTPYDYIRGASDSDSAKAFVELKRNYKKKFNLIIR